MKFRGVTHESFLVVSKLIFFKPRLHSCLRMNREQNPGYLLYMGDYATQLHTDYSKPFLYGSRHEPINIMACHKAIRV